MKVYEVVDEDGALRDYGDYYHASRRRAERDAAIWRRDNASPADVICHADVCTLLEEKDTQIDALQSFVLRVLWWQVELAPWEFDVCTLPPLSDQERALLRDLSDRYPADVECAIATSYY